MNLQVKYATYEVSEIHSPHNRAPVAVFEAMPTGLARAPCSWEAWYFALWLFQLQESVMVSLKCS